MTRGETRCEPSAASHCSSSALLLGVRNQHWGPHTDQLGQNSWGEPLQGGLAQQGPAWKSPGTAASRQRGRCCVSPLSRGTLWQPQPAAEAPWGEAASRPGWQSSREGPRTDRGKSDLHSQPLRSHTVPSTQLWGNGRSWCDPPTPPPSTESIHPYLRLPYPGGDAMVGAGEEELRANNSNRNRVEPFQLFICQMDSFPVPFFPQK